MEIEEREWSWWGIGIAFLYISFILGVFSAVSLQMWKISDNRIEVIANIVINDTAFVVETEEDKKVYDDIVIFMDKNRENSTKLTSLDMVLRTRQAVEIQSDYTDLTKSLLDLQKTINDRHLAKIESKANK